MSDLMIGVEHLRIAVGSTELHARAGGQGRVALFLHGFPDSSAIWTPQFDLLAQNARVVALDLPGYGRSGRFHTTDGYKLCHLVEHIVAVIDAVSDSPVALVGHDWGGIIAWAVAAAHPERVRHLVIVNAPHPMLLARRISDTPAQAAASAYISRLAAEDASETILSAGLDVFWNRVFADCLSGGVLTPDDRRDMIDRWSRPGAMRAMLNYYRANPIADLTKVGCIDAPTTVLWGMRDEALLPCLLDAINEFVPDLRIVRCHDATHWLPYEKPAAIAAVVGAAFSEVIKPT